MYIDLLSPIPLYLHPQTSEKQMLTREQGQEKAEDASETIIYKIEVPANR